MADIAKPDAGWIYVDSELFNEPPFGTPMSAPQLALCTDDDGDCLETAYGPEAAAYHLFSFSSVPYPARFMHKGHSDVPGFEFWRWIGIWNGYVGEWETDYRKGIWVEKIIPEGDLWQYWWDGKLYISLEPHTAGMGSNYHFYSDCMQAGRQMSQAPENTSLSSNLFGQSAYVSTLPDQLPAIEMVFEDYWGSNLDFLPDYPIPGTDQHQAEVEFLRDGALQIRYVDAAGVHHRAVSARDEFGPWIVDP